MKADYFICCLHQQSAINIWRELSLNLNYSFIALQPVVKDLGKTPQKSKDACVLIAHTFSFIRLVRCELPSKAIDPFSSLITHGSIDSDNLSGIWARLFHSLRLVSSVSLILQLFSFHSLTVPLLGSNSFLCFSFFVLIEQIFMPIVQFDFIVVFTYLSVLSACHKHFKTQNDANTYPPHWPLFLLWTAGKGNWWKKWMTANKGEAN